MDRYSTFGGAPVRGRRVPPRVSPRQAGRRGGPRTAAWDGARRWWLVALGLLAASIVLPRMARAQGLRSPVATISLTATAPPRAGSTVRSRGPSVADVAVAIPAVAFEPASVEVRLASEPASGPQLYVRGIDGALAPVGRSWVAIARSTSAMFRVVAPDGSILGAGSWHTAFRLTPRDSSAGPVELRGTVDVPASR